MDKQKNKIIDDVLDGIATEEEARKVAEQFCSEKMLEELSQRIDNDCANIKQGYEELYTDHEIPSANMWRIIQDRIRKKKIRRIIFRAAGIILPLILISALFFQLDSRVDLLGDSLYEEIYVPKGERTQVVFHDGTKVYINSDSRIRYPKKFGLVNRKIFFEGEAYFVVSGNKKRSFIIEMDKASIHVLGTSFNVEGYPEKRNIDVILDEGSVNFRTWKNKDNVMTEGDYLTYDKESEECTITRNSENKSSSQWKNNIIVFMNSPMDEVIEVLERWYDVKFIVENKEAYNYSYTMVSDNTLLEKVLVEMEKVAPVKFSYKDKVVRVNMQ